MSLLLNAMTRLSHWISRNKKSWHKNSTASWNSFLVELLIDDNTWPTAASVPPAGTTVPPAGTTVAITTRCKANVVLQMIECHTSLTLIIITYIFHMWWISLWTRLSRLLSHRVHKRYVLPGTQAASSFPRLPLPSWLDPRSTRYVVRTFSSFHTLRC